MENQSQKSFINNFEICEYMELLDEVKNFWHGDLNPSKSKFINFATELEEKRNKSEILPKNTLVKRLIKEISERR